MLKIAITIPGELPDEAARIARLLESGWDFVHIRKPDWSLRDVRNLIEDVPYPLRSRLRLHGHFDLLNDYGLAGAHLNSRCPTAPAAARSVTRSCHSLGEIRRLETSGDLDRYQYVTLSPVFDSISKPGYASAFDIHDPGFSIPERKVVALGGVTPDRIAELEAAGFAGAAMLGWVWDNDLNLK